MLAVIRINKRTFSELISYLYEALYSLAKQPSDSDLTIKGLKNLCCYNAFAKLSLVNAYSDEGFAPFPYTSYGRKNRHSMVQKTILSIRRVPAYSFHSPRTSKFTQRFIAR